MRWLTRPGLPQADRLLLCEPDLPGLQADSPYARLTVLHVDARDWQDDQQAYRLLRRIESTRYHVYPRGFMMRISTSAGREPVRVSRRALQDGLDFAKAGQLFVTAPDFPYDLLVGLADKMEAVTGWTAPSEKEEAFRKCRL